MISIRVEERGGKAVLDMYITGEEMVPYVFDDTIAALAEAKSFIEFQIERLAAREQVKNIVES